jgi:membrane protein DedA with SNARE-associated domain/membrane-associated phospholipid phosphatase
VILAAAIKWTWLVGGIGLAGFLLTRRRSHGRVTLAIGLIVAALAVAIGVRVIPLPNFEELILRVGETLGPWTYLLVGVMAYLETGAFVGLVAPGETTVIVGGLVAGQGQISLVLLIALVWTCAVAGDLTSYVLGRRLGRGFLERHGPRVKITEERLAHVEAFFARHGGVTILIGRFLGLVRALAPFLAGASRMPLRTFLPYDVLGAGAWSATFCVLGYAFWRSFHQLTTYVSRGLLGFGTLVVLVIGIWWLIQLRRDPERRRQVQAWLAAREDKPGWRPLVRAAGPLWRGLGRPAAAGAEGAARFSWARLTPGALGLELTTVLALGAVGAFAFYAIGDSLDAGAARTADDAARTLAERLRGDLAVGIAKGVSSLGTWPVCAAVALLTAAWAAARRRWIDAAALLVGIALEPLVLHAAKAAYDRPRPLDSLVDTMLSAYPSGHTTYAVTWVACALVLVRAGSGWAVRFAAVTVAVALVAAVALTRIYLGAHWLSDVLGGAALGVAVWSLVGCAALVIAYVRHNGGRSS